MVQDLPFHFFFSCFSKTSSLLLLFKISEMGFYPYFFYKYYLQLYKKSWSIIKCCSCTLLCYFINDMIFVYVSISRASSMRERSNKSGEWWETSIELIKLNDMYKRSNFFIFLPFISCVPISFTYICEPQRDRERDTFMRAIQFQN